MAESIIGVLKWAWVDTATGLVAGQTYWTDKQAQTVKSRVPVNCVLSQVLVRYDEKEIQKINTLKTRMVEPDPNAKPAGISDIAGLAQAWGGSKFETSRDPLVGLPTGKKK